MIKFDYGPDSVRRMAELEDERGAFGDPGSIGGYAQAFKRRRTAASSARHDIRFLATALTPEQRAECQRAEDERQARRALARQQEFEARCNEAMEATAAVDALSSIANVKIK